MDASDVVSIFLRGAIGRRGRKRARRAINFLSGNRGFLTASTVLGAAGVAWGIYDSLQGNQGSAAPPPSVSRAAVTPPPIPGATAGVPVLPDDMLRVVRLAISAARADGSLTPQEREMILQHARDAGIEHAVEQELGNSHPLAAIVSGVTDPQRREDLYILAFTMVRADEAVSGGERIYLAQLAHQLGLDAATVARLEQDTSAKIDATNPEP